MSCNTTFKRLVSFLLAFLLLAALLPFAAPPAASAMEASGGEENPLKPAEALLVFNDRVTEEEIENIRVITETFTYLTHSIAFAGVRDCAGKLGGYDYILCYNLKDPGRNFLSELKQCGAKIMAIGPDLIPELLDAGAHPVSNEGSGGAELSYPFTETENFVSLARVENLQVPANPEYQNGMLTLDGTEYPLFQGFGAVRYLPVTDLTTDFMRAAFTREITYWFWIYNGKPHTYAQYVVLDSVYPFADLRHLQEVVEYLVESKTNFVISAMPVYQNEDFPAMQEFCEVLKYAQANGGAVILHAPIIHTAEVEESQLKEYLTKGTESYVRNGVYPLGIEAPSWWMYDEACRSALLWFRTVFFYHDTGEKAEFDIHEGFNTMYENYNRIIAPAITLDDIGVGYLDSLATAVYLDSNLSLEEIQERVEACRDSEIPLKSLWDYPHSVYGDNSLHIQYENGELFVYEQKVDTAYTPAPPMEEYDYHRDILYRVTVSLQNQSGFLLWFVLLSLGLFLLFMVLARRQGRKKFFYKAPVRPPALAVPPEKKPEIAEKAGKKPKDKYRPKHFKK